MIIEQITKFITEKIEELTASLTAGFLCINMDLTNIIAQINIDWSYEMIRIILSLGTSVLSGYIVNRLKNKYWNKNNGNNSTNI